MIYFAGRATTAWTAISRVPWLKAIVYLEKGDRWQGGGLFTSSSTYWVNGSGCHLPARGESRLAPDLKFEPDGSYGGECPGVYYRRLQRDGWTLKDGLGEGACDRSAIFEKRLPRGWLLRKYAHADIHHPPGAGCYWDEHELEHPQLQVRLMNPQWEWADLDRGTLVWAEKGRLYRAELLDERLGEARMIFDFNPMKFEAREAPY